MEGDLLLPMDDAEMQARPYQVMLEEIAVKKNTILHLPTGSGKTFIAIQLIKRFRDALQKPWSEGGKRTFFLVNTVPLVYQHKKTIQNICAVEVGAYSSEDKVDYWDKNKWDLELEKNQIITPGTGLIPSNKFAFMMRKVPSPTCTTCGQLDDVYHVLMEWVRSQNIRSSLNVPHRVFVMTCQILCDMLTHSYISISDINLLIFDECHHAVEYHPMRLIMKHFEDCAVEKQPRVLGLTATLLNSNVSIGKIEATLRELESTYHAAIATVNELGDVLSFSTNPKESVQIYSLPIPTLAVRNANAKLQALQQLVLEVELPKITGKHDIKLKKWQQDITSDPKKIVKAVNNMINAMISYTEELGVYGGALGILSYIILLERLKRKASTKEEEKFYNFTITYCLEARMILLQSMENDSGYDKIVKHSSEKVLQLINILREYSPTFLNTPGALLKVNQEKKPLCGIIFTQQKFMAKVIYNLLKDVKEANPKEFDFLQHDFIVGFNINPLKSTREQYFLKKSSQKALLMFGNHELNCLISTSVIEEGIDIPKCLLVVRYDIPLEYRSYIQSKGRARNSESNFIMLVNQADKLKFMNNYKNFQHIERHIYNILVGNSHNRSLPSAEEIEENIYKDDVPPYVTSNGIRLSAVSAVSLLNRYCMTLPHDQFTVITPMIVREKVIDKTMELEMVTIIMPLACPFKEEIKGNPYPNLKSAKRSAALNACIRLHQEGELDQDTLLPKKYAAINYDEEEIVSCFPNWPRNERYQNEGEVPKTGTKKRVRNYKITFPSCLDSVPDTQGFCLHVIKINTAFEKPMESRERALYDFLQRDEGYGFLTQKPLPKLCDFPIFTAVGEVTTSIEVNSAVIRLDTKLFNLVKKFHYFIFDQVLAVAKKFLVYEGIVNCMYVVPVKSDNGYDIDWTTMIEHQDIQPVAQTSYEERRFLRVTQEDYQNCVVTPWYRGSILPQRYIVSSVLEYMTPRSLFGKESFGTYADYYCAKYNLDVYGSMDQPLLEVRNISSRMNCLLPRAATINTFTDKQQKMVSAAQGDDKPKGFAEIFVPEFCIKYDFPGVLWYKATLLPSIVHRLRMLLTAHELLTNIALDTKYGKPIRNRADGDWRPLKADLQVAIKSLLSNVEEPTPINTVDRINVAEEGSSGTNKKKSSMKVCLYQLQKKKIDKEYPWEEEMEPIDIERNISTVTVMDIECYDEFVSAPVGVGGENMSFLQREPSLAHAIAPPPLKYNDKIQLLHKQPNGTGPELCDMLAALTTINSHDTLNLERAETLGDSFLKFAASLYLHHKFPKMNEGQLSNIKSCLISNKNLYYAGQKFNLGGRMKVEQFSPRKDFLVPGFFASPEVEDLVKSNKIRPTFLIGMQFSQCEALTGQLSEESKQLIAQRYANNDGVEQEPEGNAQNAMQCYVHTQAVSDKSVADCVEAIVGTYLLSGGILAAVKVLEWMKVLPPQDNFAELLYKSMPTVITQMKATVKDVEFLLNGVRRDVEKIMNYTFKDPSLLLNAMSHSSYIRNRLTDSYERLEFLGDAILDFLITSYIFENCTDMKPGEMTDLRSALVNNVTFAAYTVKLGLHKFICAELNPSLSKAILKFVEHQVERNHKIEFDVLYLINEKECHIAEYIDVPKVLSDVFEALAGAIYLDSGGNLQTTWSVIYKIMCVEIHTFSACIPRQPTKLLYENMHACPVFEKPIVVDPDIPKIMVPVTFTKNDRKHTVYGVGRNKSEGKRAAAKLALKIIHTLN